MRLTSILKLCALLPMFALIQGLTCYTVEEPPCPPIEIPENTGECSKFCSPDYDTFMGRTFRLTRLEIDEPYEFAELLNPMWGTDILNNVLNVLFVVTAFEEGTDAAFNTLEFKVGPGWHSPKLPLALEPPEGGESADSVDSYCHLEGMTVEMKAGKFAGHQCTFKTTEATALYFHTGPKDSPFVCAPDLVPANAIPIKNLKARMGFNEDATAMTDGWLEGCITIEDANRICMCLVSGMCPYEPKNEGGYAEDDLTGYCKDKCGANWLSFGESVGAFGLTPSCLTPDGSKGYRLQGFIDGVEVTEKYDPVESQDCAQE